MSFFVSLCDVEPCPFCLCVSIGSSPVPLVTIEPGSVLLVGIESCPVSLVTIELCYAPLVFLR